MRRRANNRHVRSRAANNWCSRLWLGHQGREREKRTAPTSAREVVRLAARAARGFRLTGSARAHLTVCFVSGYLGFSFGRLTRGAHLSSLERKMEGWRSFTRSGTLMPPLMIIGDRPALANPSIAAAARGAGGCCKSRRSGHTTARRNVTLLSRGAPPRERARRGRRKRTTDDLLSGARRGVEP